MRLRILIIAVMLIVAACGGSDDADTDGDAADTTTTAGTAEQTTTTAGDDGAADTTTTAAPSGGDFSTATVTIGGTSYQFRASDFPAEVCNPSFFGGAQVVLAMADDSGTMIIENGSTSTLGIVLIPADTSDDPPSVEFSLSAEDVEWTANAGSSQVEGSSVDDWSIDGNRIEGTATFVSSAGDGPTPGTFEATCIE